MLCAHTLNHLGVGVRGVNPTPLTSARPSKENPFETPVKPRHSKSSAASEGPEPELIASSVPERPRESCCSRRGRALAQAVTRREAVPSSCVLVLALRTVRTLDLACSTFKSLREASLAIFAALLH